LKLLNFNLQFDFNAREKILSFETTIRAFFKQLPTAFFSFKLCASPRIQSSVAVRARISP